MSLDLTILRFIKHRAAYKALAPQIPLKAMDQVTQALVKDFGVFFRDFPEAQTIDPTAFNILLRQLHPTMDEERAKLWETQLKQVYAGEVAPEVAAGLRKRLFAAAAASELMSVVERFQAGEDFEIDQATAAIVTRYEGNIDRQAKNPQVLDDIEDLLKAEENDTGFHFRLNVLNRHIKPLRGGTLLILAARPDKGKTSVIADQVTFFAPQVDHLYPEEKRSILWLNNEGPGKLIVMRTYQAALGATTEEMVALSKQPADPAWNEKHGKDYKSKLRQAYADAIGGRPGVLRVMDIHDWWNSEVEDLFKRFAPAVVVFDMIDNIKFGGEASNGGQRTDQILEAMYQWARMMAVKYDFVAIATSQISADGDGLQYPTLAMLKDSKTGKQGAADIILTLGAVNDPALEQTRFLGCTKNKRKRTGERMSPNADVWFDADRSRFVEVTS